MADNKTLEARSKNMAAIKGKDTKPEVYLRKLLFSHGYRYRKYSKQIPGHPDIWMKKYNTAVFVNGCFWHRHHGCKFAYIPKSRDEYWNKKFADNIERDERIKNKLRDKGVKCLIVWECTIRKATKEKSEQSLINAIEEFLNSTELYEEI